MSSFSATLPLAPLPFFFQEAIIKFQSGISECEDIFELQELFFNNGWTDGLPVVPGRNLVKIRALGTDGARISRTVVIFAD